MYACIYVYVVYIDVIRFDKLLPKPYRWTISPGSYHLKHKK